MYSVNMIVLFHRMGEITPHPSRRCLAPPSPQGEGIYTMASPRGEAVAEGD